MKRWRRKYLLPIGGLLFGAMQLVRQEKNLGESASGPEALVVQHAAPAEVRRMLEVACYDCHSDHTRYPWYAEIQPSGWLLAWHVRKGKQAMNLSEFGRLSPRAQAKRLDYMVEAMQEHAMPPRSYRLMHGDARLSDAQIETFAQWAEAVRAKLAR